MDKEKAPKAQLAPTGSQSSSKAANSASVAIADKLNAFGGFTFFGEHY